MYELQVCLVPTEYWSVGKLECSVKAWSSKNITSSNRDIARTISRLENEG